MGVEKDKDSTQHSQHSYRVVSIKPVNKKKRENTHEIQCKQRIRTGLESDQGLTSFSPTNVQSLDYFNFIKYNHNLEYGGVNSDSMV